MTNLTDISQQILKFESQNKFKLKTQDRNMMFIFLEILNRNQLFTFKI